MMTEQIIPPFESVLKLLEALPKPEEDDYFQELMPQPMRKSRLEWSAREKAILFEKHRELGNKWTAISKYFPNKTENIIKSYFYASLRKLCRKVKNGILPKCHNSKNKLTPGQINHLLDYFIEIFSNDSRISKSNRKDSYMLGMLDTKELSVDIVKKYKELLINANIASGSKICHQSLSECKFQDDSTLHSAHAYIQKKLEEVNLFLKDTPQKVSSQMSVGLNQ